MSVIVDRETLALDLRTYGEDEAAQRVVALDDETLSRIQERSDFYLYNGEHMLIAKAVSLAAVEVLEGAPRDLRWKRRKLKGIWPEKRVESEAPRREPVDRKQVDAAIVTALDAAGYMKAPREAHIFLKPLAEGVKGWVSYFAERTETGAIDVTPKIGVRHDRIHDLVDRFEPHRQLYAGPTASIILGYLLPENNPSLVWRFDHETPPDEVANGLAEYIVRYGEPWMRERIPHDAIIEQVRFDERGSSPVNPERLPVALWLAGRRDEARAALGAELSKAADRTDAAAENFRQFADRFEAEVLSATNRSR